MKKALITLFALCATLTAFAQAEDEAQYNQYGQKVNTAPISAQLQDGILVFQNAKANYKMWFDIRVQGDAAVYFGYDKDLVKIGNGMNQIGHKGSVRQELVRRNRRRLDQRYSGIERRHPRLQRSGQPRNQDG